MYFSDKSINYPFRFIADFLLNSIIPYCLVLKPESLDQCDRILQLTGKEEESKMILEIFKQHNDRMEALVSYSLDTVLRFHKF